jgi:hypothetical protein
MLRVLERAATAFNKAGIPLMLLKGGALILTVYRAHERSMDDLDLLVKLEHLEDACQVLKGIGAKPGRPLLNEDFCPRFYYQREFLLGDVDPAKLDLHVRPFRPLPCVKLVPADAMWADARPLEVGKAAVLVPDAEQMLVHLAVHAAFHGCSRRTWLEDIKRWVDAHRPELNWERVAKTLRAWRLALPFRVALEAASREFGPLCPEEFTPQLVGQPARWRDRLMLWQAPRDAQHPLAHVLMNLLCTPGLRFRLAYLRAVALPSPVHMYSGRRPSSRTALAKTHLLRWFKPLGSRLMAKLRSGRATPALQEWPWPHAAPIHCMRQAMAGAAEELP